MKHFHEIRDPIHNFIKIEDPERDVLNSWPLQRLRYIHQLAMTYLVYPGATHRRFEHSLGVMELATRIFDVVTDPYNIKHDSIFELVPQKDDESSDYEIWRKTLRMAALLHDVGHLPFSHAAEKDLLPEGWDHERFTIDIILNSELRPILEKMDLKPEKIAKIATGPKKYSEYFPEDEFTTWEAILSEIITGDSFGADRIDYLLRDSYHAGVAYGKFDHYRLIDTLRILPKSRESEEPALGIESGGLHSAESLLLARYFMFKQLYLHSVRRIYDIHLKDFLKEWLPGGKFQTDYVKLLECNDHTVLFGLDEHALKHNNESALRIRKREHFKLFYERHPEDIRINLQAAKYIYNAAVEEFGKSNLRIDAYEKDVPAHDFSVIDDRDNIDSAIRHSELLINIPSINSQYVFVNPKIESKAKKWLKNKEDKIIKLK
jgi:HD superfamily phosphohydrolase